MYVAHLSLTDFRSYAQVELPLEPGITALVGPNGQGKTNLVEALGYVATLGSHRVPTDAALVRGQTIRVIVANAQALEKRKDAIDRFMQAYRETIDYMYSDNPQVLKDYAAFVQVSEPMAKRVRDEFFPKSLVDPDAIKGVDSVMKEAVNLKFISEPLTQKQLDELIQIPPRKM